MRVPMIAGNWKMNTTVSEALELVKAMRAGLDKIGNVDKVICPPFISLAAVGELIKGSSINWEHRIYTLRKWGHIPERFRH